MNFKALFCGWLGSGAVEEPVGSYGGTEHLLRSESSFSLQSNGLDKVSLSEFHPDLRDTFSSALPGIKESVVDMKSFLDYITISH